MDLGVWDAVFVQAPLHDDGERGVRLWLDLHARRDGGRFTGIVRPAVGWDLTDRTSLFAGYAAIPSGSPGATGSATFEHRAWQQLLWSSPAGPLTVGLRPRLEQRFAAGNAPALRARMFGRAQAPLSDPFAVVVWDEAFVALNDSEFGPAGFDQNRLFVGPAVSGPSHRVEIGLLHQLLRRDLVGGPHPREGAWTAVGVAAANLFVTL